MAVILLSRFLVLDLLMVALPRNQFLLRGDQFPADAPPGRAIRSSERPTLSNLIKGAAAWDGTTRLGGPPGPGGTILGHLPSLRKPGQPAVLSVSPLLGGGVGQAVSFACSGRSRQGGILRSGHSRYRLSGGLGEKDFASYVAVLFPLPAGRGPFFMGAAGRWEGGGLNFKGGAFRDIRIQ